MVAQLCCSITGIGPNVDHRDADTSVDFRVHGHARLQHQEPALCLCSETSTVKDSTVLAILIHGVPDTHRVWDGVRQHLTRPDVEA
jgi:hypothetical protein